MSGPIDDLARQLVRDGKFATENEALIHVIKVFGAAMRGALRPTTAEAEVAVLDAKDAVLDLLPELMPHRPRH